jgi:hypothetical protein
MFKTDFRPKNLLVGLVAIAAISCSVQAAFGQTIAQVAETQRAKLLAEANPAQPAVAPAVAPAVVPSKAKAPVPAAWKLHSIYKVGQKTAAEVISGDQLVHIQPGASIGQYKVTSVTFYSIKLESSKGCGRKCPSVKTVQLGGTF